jgi:hypothetical protein
MTTCGIASLSARKAQPIVYQVVWITRSTYEWPSVLEGSRLRDALVVPRYAVIVFYGRAGQLGLWFDGAPRFITC